jgi:flagellar basal-body rod protein FlgC
MNLFGLMDVSASALKAERVRAEVVATNMANAETTKTEDGGPYQRKHVVFQADGGGVGSFQQSLMSRISGGASLAGSGLLGGNDSADAVAGGVSVTGVIADQSAPLRRFDPQHPDAGPDGYVAYPDINPLTEMVDLMGATRAYGMNASAVQAEKNMVSASLDLLK